MPDWARELFDMGDIRQDDDERTDGEAIWNRYVELADAVVGDEGAAGVAAIIASLRAVDDYGAYQAAHSALARFPQPDLGRGVVMAAETLRTIPADNGGVVLLLLARSGPDAVAAFTDGAVAADPRSRAILRDLVARHESDEWLSEERGVLVVPSG
jgi:hypothetical protein